MPIISSMVSKTGAFLKSSATDIFTGFLVAWVTITFVSPAMALAGAMVSPNVVQAAEPVAIIQPPAPVTDGLPAAAAAQPLRTMKIRITAYTSLAAETDSTPFTTANGTHVRDGIFAANFLPFGTKVRIPSMYGNKVFVVEDRMNARYSDDMDIWMGDVQSAKKFGVRNLTVDVY